MALNKVRFLDEEQLLKLLNENGYQDIAEILSSRNINGQKFLELTEYQTKFWRLSTPQKKSLFSFISELKENPSIIIKREPISKLYKPPLTVPVKPTRVTQKKSVEQNEFKLKLGLILNPTNSSPPSLSTNPMSPNVPPKQLLSIPSQNVENSTTYVNIKSKNLPSLPEQGRIPENQNSKSKRIPPPPFPNEIQSTDTFKNMILEPGVKLGTINHKSKLLPIESDGKSLRRKSVLPLIKEIHPNHRLKKEDSLSEIEVVYENVHPVDYGYITSNELETGYVNSGMAKMIAVNSRSHDSIDKSIVSTNKYSSLTDNLVEMSTSSQRKLPPPPPGNNATCNLKKSPVAGRAPVPVPKERLDKRKSVSLHDLRPISSESKYDSDDYYLPNKEKRKYGNNINTQGGYLDLDAKSVLQIPSDKPTLTPEFPSPQKTKTTPTIHDLENYKEELKRPNNLIGSLNKFFTKKGKSITNLPKYKYENHFVKSEIPSVKTDKVSSYKTRPLPEIPKSEIPSGLTESERSKLNEFPGNRQGQMVENLYENFPNRNVEDVAKVVVDYNKNTDSFNIPSITSNKKLNLHNELELKLSEALKIRKLKSPQNVNTKRSEDEDDVDINHIYENVGTHRSQHCLEPPRRFSRNNSNSKIEDDEFVATPQPYYGNINDSEPAKPVEMKNSFDTNNEEEPEYVGSLFNINNEKFFRNTDRKGAKDLLNNFPDGSFLFRPSQKYFLVLTLKYSGKCYNLGIERTVNNKIRLHADTSSISPEFGTLQAFVNYFTKEAVTFRDNDNTLVEIFLNPILPNSVF